MPERIGAYRLESPLGRGGMGEVFLAWDERLERAVAIKRIRHDAFLQGHQRERFRREARMAARLSHASIVQVHDLVSEESGDAIVMEYVEGPTLSQRLTRGPFETAEAVHLAREIAEGLAAAHEAGLIHRDLKSENVVITPAGHAKILDFGLARPVCWDGEMLTQHGALIGTCYAMSPEQASGGDLDERSDLFALGALLYEMLAGCSAFRAKDPRATLQRVLYEQPPPLAEVRPDLPPALVALVERLLAKDRDDRPRNALSVVHKLEKIERELPEEERPERKDDSVSEMPTQAFPVLPGNRSGSAAASQPTPSRPAVEGPLRRARGWILFLAGALAALVLVLSVSYLPLQHSPEISKEDVAKLQEIRQRLDEGTNDLRGELTKLEQILGSSPDFTAAWTTAGDVALSLYESTRESTDLNKARKFVQGARKLEPQDSGALTVEIKLNLATQNLEEADRILKKLEKKHTGQANVLLLRSRLLESRGRQVEAEELLRKAVKQDPSWRNGFELAWMELNHGKTDQARHRLEDLVKQFPDNRSVQEQLAYLELIYGDLARAEQLYEDLAQSHPQSRYFTSLGQARSLRRRYDEAKEAYQKALDIDQGHIISVLNYADNEVDLGDKGSAGVLYGTLLKRLQDETRNLSPQEEMIKAQCLARTGNEVEARKAVSTALSRSPDDAQRLYEAALVYSVIGDREAALDYARKSVFFGMHPRWFEMSAFDPLRNESAFQALLGSEKPEQGL
jgi:serine/threonine-protein kinase